MLLRWQCWAFCIGMEFTGINRGEPVCLLKIYSDTDSFSVIQATTRMPVYNCVESGASHRPGSNRRHKHYRISFDVSNRDWGDFKGQVQDAIEFLEHHFVELEQLMASHSVSDAYLDFPLYSRLDGDVVNQNDHLPRELIRLAGQLSLGIEMAHYSVDAFGD